MNRLQSKLDKIGRDPKITAKSVGLRYAINQTTGYYRKRRGEKLFYVDDKNLPIRDKQILERIQKLVIPPAWQDVWICPYENGHLQVTGIDTKGRKQYRYHAQWNKIRNQSKFYRLRRFSQALPLIRIQVEKDLRRSGMPYEKVVALVVKLIENTNIRIGNDAYKKLYGSFGLTTLRDRHLKQNGSEIYFDFVGKKGVKHKISIGSRRLANLVKKCQEIPGQELFQYYDDNGAHRTIGSADINNYLKEITQEDFTAKDFRVWAGSVNALDAFREIGEASSATDCKRKIVEVLDIVASKLGNTRTVCRKYYVHPTVIAAYENGSISKYPVTENISDNELTPAEEALVRLLDNEKIAEVIC